MRKKMLVDLQSSVDALVRAIREYSRNQKDLWQRVPYLALEADGRSGFSDNRSRAYRLGFWALEGSRTSEYYTTYVDLATGDLLSAGGTHAQQKLVPASDENVILLAKDLSHLNAEYVVAILTRDAKEPYPSYYVPTKQDEWRAEQLRSLKIKEIYTSDQRGPIPQQSIED